MIQLIAKAIPSSYLSSVPILLGLVCSANYTHVVLDQQSNVELAREVLVPVNPQDTSSELFKNLNYLVNDVLSLCEKVGYMDRPSHSGAISVSAKDYGEVKRRVIAVLDCIDTILAKRDIAPDVDRQSSEYSFWDELFKKMETYLSIDGNSFLDQARVGIVQDFYSSGIKDLRIKVWINGKSLNFLLIDHKSGIISNLNLQSSTSKFLKSVAMSNNPLSGSKVQDSIPLGVEVKTWKNILNPYDQAIDNEYAFVFDNLKHTLVVRNNVTNYIKCIDLDQPSEKVKWSVKLPGDVYRPSLGGSTPRLINYKRELALALTTQEYFLLLNANTGKIIAGVLLSKPSSLATDATLVQAPLLKAISSDRSEFFVELQTTEKAESPDEKVLIAISEAS